MRYCLDTGVLLRLFDRRDSASSVIRSGLRTLLLRGDTFVTTAQNVAEFWNVWTRPSSARGGYGQSTLSADRHVRFFLRFGSILTESGLSFSEWHRLVSAHSVQGTAVHDARIVAILNVQGVTHILTLNPDDFRRYPGLVVLVPDDVR